MIGFGYFAAVDMLMQRFRRETMLKWMIIGADELSLGAIGIQKRLQYLRDCKGRPALWMPLGRLGESLVGILAFCDQSRRGAGTAASSALSACLAQ